MERRDFLSQLGIGAAFALTASCLGSCAKTEDVTPRNFTLNLDDAANAALKTNGGYIVTQGTVVARTIAGAYVAATVTCSHEGRLQVQYDKSTNGYMCTAHGATFDLTGKGTNSNGSKGLAIYKTSVSGSTLTVTS